MHTSTLQWSCLTFDQLSLLELYAIMALRQTVFVVEQNCPYLDADGLDLSAWHVLGKNQEKEIVAYTRILPKGTTYPDYVSIGRVITAPKTRGQGIGRPLMRQTLHYCKDIFGPSPIKISAQSHLQKFYSSLDFKAIGAEYLEDDIPHRAMIRPAEI